MASGINLFHKLQQSVSQIDPWIAENKPTSSKSEEVFKAFMARYGSSITGSDAFVAKATRIIEKASRLTTGLTVMQRLLDTDHDLVIREGKEDAFEKPSFLELDVHGPKLFYIGLNEQGERATYQLPRHSIFIHECLHAWHEFNTSEEHKERGEQLGFLPEMDSGEEELVITGNLHLDAAAVADPCCENTTLRELGRPLRINHRGTDNKAPDLHESVQFRLFPKIREFVNSSQIHNNKKEGLTALEFAMHHHLLADHPEVLQEWTEIMRILIQNGCQSEYALKLAILQNSKEIIQLLLQAGINLTEEILEDTILEPNDRFEKTWEILTQKKWVIDIFNPHPIAILPGSDPDEFFKSRSRKYKQQSTAVKGKFIDDGTLPIHTLQKLFFFNDFKGKEDFVEWSLSHSFRPIRKPLPLQTSLPSPIQEPTTPIQNTEISGPIACPMSPPNGAFHYMPNGTYVPSSTHHCYPECHKSFEDFGILDHPAFTLEEIKGFIQVIPSHHIDLLAGNLTDAIMKYFAMGYTIIRSETLPPTPDFPMPIHCKHVSCDQEFHLILRKRITNEITKALSSPETLIKGGEYSSIPGYQVDIPIVTEEGNGILQEIKDDLDGKYAHAIATLKDKEDHPVTSVASRLILTEHLTETSCYLHFATKMLVNNNIANESSFG